MIYDCFPFNNELELLDIRLHTLDKIVDRVVIAESVETHQGNPKPFYYEENKEKFADFHDKIIHIKTPKFGGVSLTPRDMLAQQNFDEAAWARATWQTNQILLGLTECKPNDIIMISDADEIPSVHAIKQLIDITEPCRLTQKEHFYWLNCITGLNYETTGVSPYSFLKYDNSALNIRISARGEKITNGGWNFCSFGGGARIKQKLASFVHGDYISDITAEQLDKLIRQNPPYDIGKGSYNRKMQIISLDDSYPKYIRDNLDKFKNLIWPGV